jgi:NAD kinase
MSEKSIKGHIIRCTPILEDGFQYVCVKGDDGCMYIAVWRGQRVEKGDIISINKNDIEYWIPKRHVFDEY